MEGIEAHAYKESFTFSIDSRIYSMPIVFKAAYVFIERFYIVFSLSEQTTLMASFTPKVGNVNEIDPIIGEFYNELLHQTLRFQIYQQTKDIRELIIGRALYATCIRDPIKSKDEHPFSGNQVNSDHYDYNVDPLGIRKSWFDE